MEGLFQCDALPSFGPSSLSPARQTAQLEAVSAPRTSALRVHVREQCPKRAGVYGMVTAEGDLIYIGKAKCLRSRLLTYFRPRSRDPKAGHILSHARTIAWERAPSEFAALLRELELIRRWRPRLNVMGQPGRRHPIYLCLGGKPAPQLFITRQPQPGMSACFGPLSGDRQTRNAVRWLNDWYRLQDCPQPQELVFADQGELFPVQRSPGCLRYELGTCLGPCVSACSRHDYFNRVRGLQAFLAGRDDAPLIGIEHEMRAAAREMAYERAAVLLEKLEAFRWLRNRLERLSQAREKQSFIYPVQGQDGSALHYLIHGGRVIRVLSSPRSREQERRFREHVRRVYAARAGEAGPVPAGEIDSVWLVAGWFRSHPEEKARLINPKRFLPK